jgi:polysaccharide export outer membrane protein
MKAVRLVTVLCILCLAWTWATAQSDVNSVAPQEGEPSQIQTKNAGDEPVGADDLIYVSVTGAPELTRAYRVSKEGQLSLPLLPEGVPVGGTRPVAIARAISEALVRDQVLVDPIVSVQVLEYRSRRVTVSGAVKEPVTVEATGNMKLLDAIARANGLAPDAGPEIIVSHAPTATEAANTVRIPVNELINDKDSTLNIRLHGGEEIRVPQAARLYIAGNVKEPGTYPIKEIGGLSVRQALALSQGTLSYTAKVAYIYRAVPGSTERQQIAVPLHDIVQRKAPDVQLLPDDVLYVPENSKARLSASVLTRIVGVATSAIPIPH